METTIYIETDRLILRGWKETDREAFAMMQPMDVSSIPPCPMATG